MLSGWSACAAADASSMHPTVALANPPQRDVRDDAARVTIRSFMIEDEGCRSRTGWRYGSQPDKSCLRF
jgi:hypothetical protein